MEQSNRQPTFNIHVPVMIDFVVQSWVTLSFKKKKKYFEHSPFSPNR